MDQDRLVNLWDEYQKNKDTYTPEQQEAMENKFWALVERALWERKAAEQEQMRQQQMLYQQAKLQTQQKAKPSKPKDTRVTL